MSSSFSDRLLGWYDRYGRKDLPWQRDITPYRVWVSEIMLQQTQVNTVIPYFQRFTAELPNVQALAEAPEDQVLHLWTGLGYYSRARNLHRSAKLIAARGEFPATVEELSELPGIGRSTAGAIVAIAYRRRAPILDGNVKRVLARYHAVAGWPGQSAVSKALWRHAEAHTPEQRVADYTQAIMDLGATLCTRARPACALCPLRDDCQAYATGRQQDYPGKKPRRVLPTRRAQVLLIETARGEVLLEKRPPQGIWGGLWSLPQLSAEEDALTWCRERGLEPAASERWQMLRHSFSHYHFEMQPVRVRIKAAPAQVMEGERELWYNLASPQSIGLAAPVKQLLAKLPAATTDTEPHDA